MSNKELYGNRLICETYTLFEGVIDFRIVDVFVRGRASNRFLKRFCGTTEQVIDEYVAWLMKKSYKS